MPAQRLSITYWNRLEPRPRSAIIEETLAARVRDPLWFLTRQWQLGEFRGADAGSIAHVEMAPQLLPIDGAADGPLEPASLNEPLSADLYSRAELGLAFLDLLAQRQPGDAVRAFYLARYPLPADDSGHRGATAFLASCKGRALDGLALYREVVSGVAPAAPGVDAAAASALLADFRALADADYRAPSISAAPPDAAAWRAERLEYEGQATAAKGACALSVRPGWDGSADWASFDRADQNALPPTPAATSYVLPAHVRFTGMPAPRFWDFESASADFGKIDPKQQDLSRMLFIDFMMLHGHDWFVFALDVPVGTLCRLGALTVVDVFGVATPVQRADAAAAPGRRWTMFSASSPASMADGPPADFYVAAPACAPAQRGPALEEVRFFRDEQSDAAWAMEEIVESPLGTPWPGAERSPPAPAPPPTGALAYSIQSPVPGHWFPFIPTQVDPSTGQVALTQAALIYDREPPRTRILHPTAAPAPYRIHDHEVPRSGIAVERAVRRARWIDGSTRLWVARSKRVQPPAGPSGLRFDLAEPRGQR